MLKVLDLFSGIGGFSLGLQRTKGFTTIAYCEIDPYCRKVLEERMKETWLDSAPIFEDVTKLCRRIYDCEPETEDGGVECPRCKVDFGDCECIGTDQFTDTCGFPDIITGGFPCQDISQIGKRAGIHAERSGLWREFQRIVGELRPAYALVENTSALLGGGLDVVLGDLAALGYDAEWDCFPAYSAGAPHRRDRTFVLAYSVRERLEGYPRHEVFSGKPFVQQGKAGTLSRGSARPGGLCTGQRPEGWWAVEPRMGRVAHGIPRRVDRISALGNAVVPQVIEWIGNRILEAR